MKKSRLYVSERQTAILEFLKTNKEATVSELSELCKTSEITIRRDLITLEHSRLITRYHGGAKIIPMYRDDDIFVKSTINRRQKELIAKKATEFVHPNDTVFINAGSTTTLVIQYLWGMNVKIITNNMLATGNEYSKGTELVFTGGDYTQKNQSLSGELAAMVVNKTTARVAILGASGLSSDLGVTSSVYPETLVTDAMIKRCTENVIVVADGSKIGNSQHFLSTPLSNINTVITDTSADMKEIRKIRDKGIKVIILEAD